MLDWRGNEIEVARSAGGVLAVTHPWDNLVRTGIAPWPTPELLHKKHIKAGRFERSATLNSSG
jgi:hypothetical protein